MFTLYINLIIITEESWAGAPAPIPHAMKCHKRSISVLNKGVPGTGVLPAFFGVKCKVVIAMDFPKLSEQHEACA